MKPRPYNAKFRQVAQVDGMDEDYSDVYDSGGPTARICKMCGRSGLMMMMTTIMMMMTTTTTMMMMMRMMRRRRTTTTMIVS